MLNFLRKVIPENSILRLFYSWTKAVIAKVIYKNPSSSLLVIGVTGTDGKTSTTHFIADLFENLGYKVAMSSTEQIWLNSSRNENKTKRTTLSPFYVQDFLAKAKKFGAEIVVVEVSSHAISQGRVFGVEFDIAVCTNISQEHSNYHSSIKEYATTKSKLFDLVKKSAKKNKLLLSEHEIIFPELFVKKYPSITKTYSIENHKASLFAEIIDVSEKYSLFDLPGLGLENLRFNIPGSYNLKNLLAAILISQHLDVSKDLLKGAIEKIKTVPGRLEEVKINKNFKVFVDFALTPGAFKQLLSYGQKIKQNKLWIVFGCTGANHDHEKRPQMGSIASELADMVVVTEDESYGENNEKIMSEITKDIKKNNYIKISDRREAICYALDNAKKGDVIFITGMGNFESRNNGKEEIPWSDRQEVINWSKS